MAEKVARVGIRKADGWLYFVDKHGDISRSKMARGGRKKGYTKTEKVSKVGVKKDAGYLYFVDRKLDLIKRGAKYIPASTIEAVVSQHEGVAECVAVGVPSGSQDDEIKLCVICKEGEILEPEELVSFCAEKMEDDLVPRYVQFRSSFPRSSRGKVQRYKLQAEGVPEGTWHRYNTGTAM